MNLLHLIQDKLRTALTGLAPDVEAAAALVRPTQDGKFGDYQANCAMSLAKALSKKPREIAEQIAARLPLGDELQPPEIAGPGFLNLRLRPDWLAKQVQRIASDERLGIAPVAKPRTIVIDYSSPNVAKPLHVGHLRSTIIGESLARLFRFLGHTVIADNHLGDWGTQFGFLLYGYKNYLNAQAYQADPVRELARLYLLVREMLKEQKENEDEAVGDAITEAARLETAKLHAGDPENLRIWKMFMPHCMEEIERIYRRLDIKFDYTLGESFYNPQFPAVVASLCSKGIAEESRGAKVIFFDEQEPPALVQKSDGAYTYMTSDLATVQHRVEQWHADELLYVVDQRQALHFKHLFQAAQRWGFERVAFKHISFGSVLGEDRKPLKTRDGKTPPLDGLLNDAVSQAKCVYQLLQQEARDRGEEVVELPSAELQELLEVIGVGAVKYADMCQNRTTDYIFSLPKMVAMTGNTATYMQYAYVRVRGIFRKADVEPAVLRAKAPAVQLTTPQEIALALALLRFDEALEMAAADYQPSAITAYLWELSKAYSSFFQHCPVLRAETPELRASRLLLCDVTGRTIQRGLDLLGIRTPERM